MKLLASVAISGYIFMSCERTVGITVNEKSYVRKFKDVTLFKGATSQFLHTEKSSLVFSVCNLQSLLIFALFCFDLFKMT